MDHKQFAEFLFARDFLYDKTTRAYVNFCTGTVVPKNKVRPENFTNVYVDEPDIPPSSVFVKGIGNPVGNLSYGVPHGSKKCKITLMYTLADEYEGKKEYEIPIIIVEGGSYLRKYQLFRRTKNKRTFIGYFSETEPKRFIDIRSVDHEKYEIPITLEFDLIEGASAVDIRLGGTERKDKTYSAESMHIEIIDISFS